eukprot:530875_1
MSYKRTKHCDIYSYQPLRRDTNRYYSRNSRDRHRDRHHINNDRNRSRSRNRERHKSPPKINCYTPQNNTNKNWNSKQSLYGTLFSKKYQSIIFRIMDELEIISFGQIYRTFKRKHEYDAVFKEFNENEHTVKLSLKKLLMHFMSRKSRVLQQNQYHKLATNLPLQTGSKYDKFKRKMHFKFGTNEVKESAEIQNEFCGYEMKTENKINHEQIDDFKIFEHSTQISNVDTNTNIQIDDEYIKIKKEKTDIEQDVAVDELAEENNKTEAQSHMNTQNIFDNEMETKKERKPPFLCDDKEKYDDIANILDDKDDIDILCDNVDDGIIRILQDNINIKFCPVCGIKATRTDDDIRDRCSVMTCRDCIDQKDYTYWCWDCSNVLDMNNLTINPKTNEPAGACQQCRRLSRKKRNPCKKVNYRC